MIRRFCAWFVAVLAAMELEILEGTPGWVVMATMDDDSPDWHAMSGGSKHGMDKSTGRFETRYQARQFAFERNNTADAKAFGIRFYVTHESVLNRPLPAHY